MPKQQKTVDVAKTCIAFDRALNGTAGHLKVVGDPHIADRDGQTLLHLLFFLTYSREGRELLRANRPWRAGGEPVTAAQAKDRLTVALKKGFALVPDEVLALVIDTHLAADAFAGLKGDATDADRQQREAIYSQRVLAVLGALHDDAMEHEFSMNW